MELSYPDVTLFVEWVGHGALFSSSQVFRTRETGLELLFVKKHRDGSGPALGNARRDVEPEPEP